MGMLAMKHVKHHVEETAVMRILRVPSSQAKFAEME